MQFSIWESSGRPWAELAEIARFADAGGWYGLWVPDHYMLNTGDESVIDGPVLEAWSLLPALAAITTRLRLGPLVSPTSVHHPALLANRAAAIDRISDGRFVLGLGAGWQINEHRAYGFALEAPKERVDRFEEGIRIVRSMLDEPRTTFEGRYYTVLDAPNDPPPVQPRLPIIVGTGSPRMLRITARHAQEWNTWGAPATVQEKLAALHRACEQVDRDPATVHTTAQALVVLCDSAAAAAAARDRTDPTRTIVGTTEQLRDQVAGYAELGIDELIIPGFALPSDVSARRDAYARLWDEVATAFV